MTSHTPEEFRQRLESRLRVAGVAEPIVGAAGAGLSELLVTDDVSGSLQARFKFPFQEDGYLLGEDDLDLLDRSFQLSSGAATAGFGLFANAALAEPTAVLGIVGVGFNVYRTLHRFRRKAARVTAEQYTVVGALGAIDGPATAADVQAVLGARGDDVDVAAVLATLTALRLPDGSDAGFIRQDGDGRWRLVGI